MALGTVTATRAASTFPVFSGLGSGNLCVAYGTYEIGSNPAQNDVIQICRIPKNAVVVGGWVYADDLDVGTEALDIDIGYAANGVDTADPDAWGNLGVWTGDATTDVKPVAGNMFPFQGTLLTDGPKQFGAETIVQFTVNAAANSGGTGTISAVVYYVVP